MHVSRQTLKVSETLTYHYLMCKILKDNGTKEYWFKGTDITKFLGYKHLYGALRQHVIPEYKKTWKELKEMNPQIHFENETFKKIKLDTIFIDEPGLWDLIIRCNLPMAKKMKYFIFQYEDILSLLFDTDFRIMSTINFNLKTLFQYKYVRILKIDKKKPIKSD